MKISDVKSRKDVSRSLFTFLEFVTDLDKIPDKQEQYVGANPVQLVQSGVVESVQDWLDDVDDFDFVEEIVIGENDGD